MAFQYSVLIRNAKLDQVQTVVGPSPVLKVFSGVEPINCANPDPSGLLCTINLPAVWMNPASNGIKTLAGTWTGAVVAGGTIASWRIYETTATICHLQGNTSDMTFSSLVIVSGRTLTVAQFQLTSGNI